MKYKINDLILDNPLLTIITVVDKVEHKICDLVLLRAVHKNGEDTIDMVGFEYQDSWEDQDIINWAYEQLKPYKIDEKVGR